MSKRLITSEIDVKHSSCSQELRRMFARCVFSKDLNALMTDKKEVELEIFDFEDEPQILILPADVLDGVQVKEKLGNGSSSSVFHGVDKEKKDVAVKIIIQETEEHKLYKIFSDADIAPKFYFSKQCEGKWKIDSKRPKPMGPDKLIVTIIVTEKMDYTLREIFSVEIMKLIGDKLIAMYDKIAKMGYEHCDWRLSNIMLDKNYNVKLVDYEDAGPASVSDKHSKEQHRQFFLKWISELKKGDKDAYLQYW